MRGENSSSLIFIGFFLWWLPSIVHLTHPGRGWRTSKVKLACGRLSVGNCLDHWLLSEGPALCGWKHPWEDWTRKPGDGEPECEIVSHVPTHFRFSSCLTFCPDFPWWPTYDPWDELIPFLPHVGKVLAFLVLVFIKTKDTLSFLHAFCVGGRLISHSSLVCFSVLWRPWLSFISNYSPYIICPFFLH